MTDMTNEAREEDKLANTYTLQGGRTIEERVARAVDNFMQGYGCCRPAPSFGLPHGKVIILWHTHTNIQDRQ